MTGRLPGMPTCAMVLAAGMGLRMRSLTRDRPKALVEVAGRTLIDRALDRLAEAGVGRAVVNLHYQAEMLRDHLGSGARAAPETVFSDESEQLLDTGGGVRAALDYFDDEPFFVVNCDALWLDGAENTLRRMASAWDPPTMDALLLMVPTATALGYDGSGDFVIAGDGRLQRKQAGEVAAHLFGGVQMLRKSLFKGTPEGPFSLNLLYDKAEARGRLFGIAHTGGWIHVGTPEAVSLAENALGARTDHD